MASVICGKECSYWAIKWRQTSTFDIRPWISPVTPTATFYRIFKPSGLRPPKPELARNMTDLFHLKETGFTTAIFVSEVVERS
jgi:hypothetical protein